MPRINLVTSTVDGRPMTAIQRAIFTLLSERTDGGEVPYQDIVARAKQDQRMIGRYGDVKKSAVYQCLRRAERAGLLVRVFETGCKVKAVKLAEGAEIVGVPTEAEVSFRQLEAIVQSMVERRMEAIRAELRQLSAQMQRNDEGGRA